MNDTSPLVESVFLEMMMRKSGQERLMMGFSMFEMARKQVVASIKRDNPNVGTKDIRREIFLRFYGQDFSLEEREKILCKLGLSSNVKRQGERDGDKPSHIVYLKKNEK